MDHVPVAPEPRYTELDSLRGVAALTVVFHHFRLMWLNEHPPAWLTLANPLTAGHEAVMLFFLLSGFVLSVPYLRGRGQSYPVYLLRRILRIYGPYFFALVLAVLCAAKWHGPLAGADAWAKLTWNQPVSWRLVLSHVVMVGNYDWSQYNTAFWSLVYEMRISLIFPLLYLLVRRMGSRWSAVLALGMTLSSSMAIVRWPAMTDTLMTISYGAIFVWGILFATNVERVNAWYRGLDWAKTVLVAVGAIVLYTWGHHIATSLHVEVAGINQILITAGAAGYMILAMNAHWIRRILNSRAALWLGGVSYSLYLVHGTLLFALAHTLGRRPGLIVLFGIFVSGSLPLAYVFNLAVEEPFLKLSRRVSRLDKARRAAVSTQCIAAGPAA